jgi:thiamine biosynthesis protein ThiI
MLNATLINHVLERFICFFVYPKEMLYIIRYGEIFLKGKNRTRFENHLINNIQLFLKRQNVNGKIAKRQARIFLETNKQADLRMVFGIVSYSPAKKTKASLEAVRKAIKPLINGYTSNTKFRVSTQRADKNFEHTSLEVDKAIGSFVIKQTGAKVSLKEYEKNIGVEIIDGSAYVFTETIPCFGGLPTGVEGKVYALIGGEASLLAAILAMKRGCDICPVAFKQQKTELLQKYSPRPLKLEIIKNIKDLQPNNCRALVVGQTLKELTTLKTDLTVLRPLIAYTNNKILKQLQEFRCDKKTTCS